MFNKMQAQDLEKIALALGVGIGYFFDDPAPAVTHGDHSPAVTGSGNVVTTGGGDSATEAALRERVRLLEELVAEKERTIGLLMQRGK